LQTAFWGGLSYKKMILYSSSAFKQEIESTTTYKASHFLNESAEALQNRV
jgi:hypothetical protein